MVVWLVTYFIFYKLHFITISQKIVSTVHGTSAEQKQQKNNEESTTRTPCQQWTMEGLSDEVYIPTTIQGESMLPTDPPETTPTNVIMDTRAGRRMSGTMRCKVATRTFPTMATVATTTTPFTRTIPTIPIMATIRIASPLPPQDEDRDQDMPVAKKARLQVPLFASASDKATNADNHTATLHDGTVALLPATRARAGRTTSTTTENVADGHCKRIQR
jgi:hypothetical protein